jgi:hypothetical protein
MSNPIKIFISYAREDEQYKDKLIKFFDPKIRDNTVVIWDDRQILPGINWENEIDKKLYEADVIIMLISPDFLCSDYIQGKEFSVALERHEKEAWAIGVVVEDCLWEDTGIAKFQVLPLDAKPIALFTKSEVNSIYKDIVNKVIKAADISMPNKKGKPSDSTPKLDHHKIDKPKSYIIPLPHLNHRVSVNEGFYTEAMPHFAEKLYAFALYLEKIITEHKQSYDWVNASSIDKVNNFLTFLQTLCRTVNKMFFNWDGVRTHFRFLHSDKNSISQNKECYYKLAAALGGIDTEYALTPIPSINEGMIYYAALHDEPLIYSLNPEYHFDKYGRKTLESRKFQDYITFVLNCFKDQNKYLLSMGISFINPDNHRNLYYVLNLCRFDEVITAVIKSYAKEANIDIAKIIVENQDYIYDKFYKDYEH